MTYKLSRADAHQARADAPALGLSPPHRKKNGA